jgi:PleD family two-component response regulator
LQKLSDAIRGVLGAGPQASPSRMGGEEFLLVFESTAPEEAKNLVEGLQRALTTKYFLQAEGSRLVTFSVGVTARLANESPFETISRADEAILSEEARKKQG